MYLSSLHGGTGVQVVTINLYIHLYVYGTCTPERTHVYLWYRVLLSDGIKKLATVLGAHISGF